MAKEIFMPKLSSTMETGTLLEWFKEEGDRVEIGEPLFEILTDKINIEVEAYDDGVLLKKYFDTDDQIPVNHVIGYIGQADEQVPEESPGESGESNESNESSEQSVQEETETEKDEKRLVATSVISSTKPRATPAAKRIAKTKQVDLTNVAGSGPNGRVHVKDVNQYVEEGQVHSKITPLANKIAQQENIDVTTISGSGLNGKIVKQDISTAIQEKGIKESDSSKKRRKIGGMRKIISDRMSQSAFTAPHVTLTSEVDMTKVKELRTQLLPIIEKQTSLRLSYTEVIIKAVGLVLSRFPAVNASFIDDEIIYNDTVHIGLAVAVPDGLMVPVLKDVNQKGLADLTMEAKDIGKRAREQKLLPDQLKGSTFTISNLGMYAIDVFTPIINQPETAILGVGRMLEKPVVVNDNIKIRPMMTLSMSFDHRVIDGAPAAEFLTELKRVLENPFELLV
ncbi:dihydrolipoamide acetyltransferase family protein [Priestia endophytica]|uniref:Dihydrolipoamide acetyltransferase component of pyruvate dehydrogenase complex n=1 Tax=Priestia endophytica DSM 13796 TaxID=1121089 RepID=A0A1I5YMP1_9BACI|nr:dihydrolipoamide acetyltransferase family protein [Priestia endophytica]KYG33657.1 branched-chain alpha-keto acid dehydrogenase subunit E2 [Priestia endophytica]SFQ45443.1 pyruvate dehydrogenase E2 component (dihydrolipoamide acetyltransferase) [Priestia endophytica DSM 13796]